MATDNPYGILFEPVPVGPVVAKNRFYQVPHCCGMGHLRPRAHAAMRAMKAEGGWAVVSTEEAEIHPSSDLSPYPEQRIWDEKDIPALQLMTEAVHSHHALAAIELVHNGHNAPNLYTRTPALAPVDMALVNEYPKQARAMNRADIRELRRWHRGAAKRARQAGFDIVYVYAGHLMTLAQHFLLPQFNTRTDEYGGSLENRVRLIRELLEDTHNEIGDSCAVALRFAVDEMRGPDGMQAQEEGRAVVELLADLPDLWDVNVADWPNDSATSRFVAEDGYQIAYIDWVKQCTDKPVVATGRLGSPDTMVSLVRRGIVDFIGAARPSISDPFLPNKIRDNRIDEIRECIGCNICVSCDSLGIPIRCTQNPTMGEEWRRGWHPESIEPKQTDARVLVVGAGPAGLECAMQLARRGFDTTLAEARRHAGGRASAESQLKGLSAWRRVSDNRRYDLDRRANVSFYHSNRLDADDIIELQMDAVFVATGARWRRDGVGRSNRRGIANLAALTVLTPDDICSGELTLAVDEPIVIYDDEHAYMGGVIADHLASAGHPVTLLTSADVVSPWTKNTLEQHHVQRSLIEQDVTIITNCWIDQVIDSASVQLRCNYTDKPRTLRCKTLLLVTERTPETGVFNALRNHYEQKPESARPHLELIGDALSPGLIADAVFAGHLAARNFQQNPARAEHALFRREIPALETLQ